MPACRIAGHATGDLKEETLGRTNRLRRANFPEAEVGLRNDVIHGPLELTNIDAEERGASNGREQLS